MSVPSHNEEGTGFWKSFERTTMIIALTAEFGIAAFVFSVVILIALLLFVAVSFQSIGTL